MVIYLERIEVEGEPPGYYVRNPLGATFPNHNLVVSEIEASAHPHYQTGKMYHYRHLDGRPTLVSTFVSWRCRWCDENYIRFVDHQIRLPTMFNATYRCQVCVPSDIEVEVVDDLGGGGENQSQPPKIEFRLFPIQLQDYNSALLVSFYGKDCHRCQTRHFYALDLHWWDEGGICRHGCVHNVVDHGAGFLSRWMSSRGPRAGGMMGNGGGGISNSGGGIGGIGGMMGNGGGGNGNSGGIGGMMGNGHP